MSEQVETMTSEVATLKLTYGVLFDEVSAALFAADPMGTNVGNNTGVYDSQAGTVLPRLQAAHSADDVQVIVFEEFCRWFENANAGDVGRFEEVSDIICEAPWLRSAAKAKTRP
jgi:hypothetical protein